MGLLFVFVGCNTAVEKPKKLIERDKMIDILYDIRYFKHFKNNNIQIKLEQFNTDNINN